MVDFLDDFNHIPWSSEKAGEIKAEKVIIGQGQNALEIVVTTSRGYPTKNDLVKTWKDRQNNRPNPILLVNLHNNSATICGITGDEPEIQRELDPDQAERISRVALQKPNRHAAYRFLRDRMDKLDSELMGVINRGLFSTHELKKGVPERPDWSEAGEKAEELLDEEGKSLVKGLGFELEELSRSTYILKDNRRNTAVAVFLDEGISFESPQETFNSKSPVNWALKRADENRVPFVIANSGKTLRLYSTEPETGFGSLGRSDTYVEVNLDLLSEDNCGYLWLLFSAPALRDEGAVHEIIENSKDYAVGLGERLKERVYDEVVPGLAEGIAEARNLTSPDKKELDTTFRMALLVLFRLLFIAYGEDERLLPYGKNSRYDAHSLKSKAHSIEELLQEGREFDSTSTSHWDDVMRLTREIHDGNSEWQLPRYNGRLLSSDPEVAPAGAELEEIKLTNDRFGPILANLLIDETESGFKGPIDFRDLGVREFGVIYEGLLESELSVADQDLTLDDERYVPAEEGDEIVVEKGEVYLHGTSGERKATGTYYTKSIFVDHLLEHSLEPALEEHLSYLDDLTDRQAEEEFFNFRVADIAMGSGHFLISAVDKIEKKFSKYLTERDLPGIEEELDRLRKASKESFHSEEIAPEVDDSQLLRRQIARRCIYGVDLNTTAVDLARLSIWVHTFIPGLPLTFLNHNLVTGDSLAGIGTIEEAQDMLEQEELTLFSSAGSRQEMEKLKEKVNKLGKLADANASEVTKARRLLNEINQTTENYRALFDILSASRISEEIEPETIFNKISDVKNIKSINEYELAEEVLENIDPLHFPLEFPEVFKVLKEEEGFDVIIGNPPWEEEILEIDKFWMRYEPGLQGKPQREKEKIIKKLEEERPDLVKKYEKEREEKAIRRKMLVEGSFEGMNSGDPDTYKAFYWRFWGLLKHKGFLGVVLPRSAFMAAGSEDFRKKLLSKAKIVDLVFLLNKRNWVFDIHPQYTISLLSFKKEAPKKETKLPLKGPYPSLQSYKKGKEIEPHKFPVQQAKNWTKRASFPLLPAEPESVEVFKKMAEHPPLDYNKPKEWRVVPHRELDASLDKKKDDGTILMHFTEEPPEDDYWPVYKGNSFNLWQPDTGVRYAWADPVIVLDYLQEKRKNSYRYAGSRSAFSEMSEEWIYDKDTLPCLHARIAFRNVTNRTNKRTIITSMIPSKVILTNAAPYFIWPRGDEKDEAYLLGIMSSVPFDWYARRFVEANVNYHLLNAFPVPRPGRDSNLRNRIVELSGKLAAVDDRFKDWAKEVGVKHGSVDEDIKNDHICEIDALVSHLYGLSRSNIEVIFATFHEGWDYRGRLDRVLAYYDEWEAKL